jgi:hypothetical protein
LNITQYTTNNRHYQIFIKLFFNMLIVNDLDIKKDPYT